MRFEDTARRAGHDLREASITDVEAALIEFQQAVPRRRRAHAAAAVVSIAAVLVITLTVPRWLVPDGPRNAQPAADPQVTSSSSASETVSGVGCENALITCHGHRRYTVALKVPMEWTIPRGFEAPYSGAAPTSTQVETYTVSGGRGGVTVLQGVRAAKTQESPGAVPVVGSAESFANWLAQRDFLSTSRVQSGRVDGYPAWSVDAVVRPGQPPGPAVCNRWIDCYPMMLTDNNAVVGTWEGMASRYTVLDLPGAGVTVVWSWGLDGEIPRAADELIASIRFG